MYTSAHTVAARTNKPSAVRSEEVSMLTGRLSTHKKMTNKSPVNYLTKDPNSPPKPLQTAAVMSERSVRTKNTVCTYNPRAYSKLDTIHRKTCRS